MSLKVGVIGLVDGWSTQELVRAFKELGAESHLLDSSQLSANLKNKEVRCGDHDLTSFDLIVIKKIASQYSPHLYNRLEILNFLHRHHNVPVHADPDKIKGMVNRMDCVLKLAEAGCPMPPTLITENYEEALAFTDSQKQIILKPLFTSKARGMVMLSDSSGKERLKIFQQAHPMMFLQKKIEIPGRDLAVVFLGDEYVATYARRPQGEWTKDGSNSSKYSEAVADDKILKIARQAKDVFGLEFSSVDIVESDQGPVVFEVSAFGGYRGLKEGCGIDMALKVADFYMKKYKK